MRPPGNSCSHVNILNVPLFIPVGPQTFQLFPPPLSLFPGLLESPLPPTKMAPNKHLGLLLLKDWTADLNEVSLCRRKWQTWEKYKHSRNVRGPHAHCVLCRVLDSLSASSQKLQCTPAFCSWKSHFRTLPFPRSYGKTFLIYCIRSVWQVDSHTLWNSKITITHFGSCCYPHFTDKRTEVREVWKSLTQNHTSRMSLLY